MDSNSCASKDFDYDEENCCLPEATACVIANSSYLMAGADIEKSQILDTARSEASDIIAAAERDIKSMQEEVTKWELEKEYIANKQTFANPVKLDVGGAQFTTSLTTLCRFPESMLGVMFSGRHELPVTSDGCYFIDRDGSQFNHILNFLRDPENFSQRGAPSTENDLRGLRIEATYYGLQDEMFPRAISLGTTAEEEPLLQEEKEHHYMYSFRASIGGIFLRVTASLDSQRRWCLLPDKNIYCNPSSPVVATCCRACGSAYILTQSFLSPHIGVKGFVGGTSGRVIQNEEQPQPEPRTCPTCPHV